MHFEDHVTDYARRLAGNHRKFPCFGWSARPEDDERWTIVYTHNRDSGLLEQSNAHVIEKTLEPYTEGETPDVVAESHNHWACGWVDGYAIRVYRADGSITDAFRAYVGLALQLEDYPVLDEEDYSERQLEATMEGVRQAGERFTHDEVPDTWADDTYTWLSENDPGALEDDGQDQGGYPDDDEIQAALKALGYHEDCPEEDPEAPASPAELAALKAKE
jgi:hypothetical protein